MVKADAPSAVLILVHIMDCGIDTPCNESKQGNLGVHQFWRGVDGSKDEDPSCSSLAWANILGLGGLLVRLYDGLGRDGLGRGLGRYGALHK